MYMPISKNVNENFALYEQALLEKYQPVLERVSATDNFTHVSRNFNRADALGLGMQLEQYKQYEQYFVGEASSASDLGQLPKVATDLIAASYAISIAPLLASMQTLPERQGMIYFKKVHVGGMVNRFPYTTDSNGTSNGLGSGFGPQARGQVGPGDALVDAQRGWLGDTMQYATEQVFGEELEFSGTAIDTQVKMFPVRSEIPVRITYLAGTTIHEGTFMNRGGGANDVGVLMSSDGFWTGTIQFSTGHIQVNAPSGLDSSGKVTVQYMQNFETAASLPTIQMTNASTSVTAEVIAIAQDISTLKAFEMSRRFGRSAESDALMDLAGTMADIESRRIISGYVEMANWIETADFSQDRPITFDMSTPAGLSAYEYRQGFRYQVAELDTEINLNCGIGAANRYIAGHNAALFLSSLPKWESAPANQARGPHVAGYYDGKPVIRTAYLQGFVNQKTQTAVHPSDVLIGAYLNPQSPFDAPMVEATYMPVFITNTMQIGHNPLQNLRAIATWKAFKTVTPHYVKAVELFRSAA
jgi:hypothetical protein